MPPKRKGRNNNKEKKGRHAGGGGCSSGAAAAAPRAQQQQQQEDVAFRIMSNLPTFHGKGGSARNDPTFGCTGSGGGGYYEIYKKATTRFCDWMRSALPKSRMRSVNDLRRGADEIMDHNIRTMVEQKERPQQQEGTPPNPIVAPADIMEELSTCIMYRQKFTDTKFGDSGDFGHRYMIDTLRYCRSVLKFSRSKQMHG